MISLITTSRFAKSYGSSAMPGPKSGSAPVYESSGSRVPPFGIRKPTQNSVKMDVGRERGLFSL